MEDLQSVEHVARLDPNVIEQCGIIGIPKEDMHKVYCDCKLFNTYPGSSELTMQSLDNWLRREIW